MIGHFLHTCLVNAAVLYNDKHKDKLTLLKYQEAVVKERCAAGRGAPPGVVVDDSDEDTAQKKPGSKRDLHTTDFTKRNTGNEGKSKRAGAFGHAMIARLIELPSFWLLVEQLGCYYNRK
jgi:hypothetical protein